ncbi:MAG: chromosomal replication initiator protein DnaA [Actinomycetota bacterium]|nr:chromosomal replication initiator protein DnaA [Actinomycetota bacterium]
MRATVSERAYSLWLVELQALELAPGRLTLSSPPHTCHWVGARFGRVLQAAAGSVLGPGTHVEIVPAAASASPADGARPPARPPALPFRELPLNPKYTFEQFVIGDGNRLAHAAALAVAELPGQAYNPLFIHGPPGLGKTHLLHAISAYLQAYNPSITVRASTVEDFTNDFMAALRTDSMGRFKAHYRNTDVLIIDDVQFLQSKARTEEEFLHTFNALYETGSQLVLASDRLPRDMRDLEDRLCERFVSGLVTDIQLPDFDTRVAILRKRAQHDGIDLGDDAVLELIAARITENVRALEGALIRLIAYQSLTRTPITPDRTLTLLDRLYPAPPVRRYSIPLIEQAVSEAFDVSTDDLRSRKRTSHVALARQIAMFLSRDLTDATLPAIGRHFGGRDHTTVMHACQQMRRKLTANAGDLRAAITRVRAILDDAQL